MENQTEEVNNLKKYGTAFQAKCLGILLTDRPFLERIIDILSPDYFETDAHKWIIGLLMEYFPKYKELPTFSVFKVELNKLSNEILKISAAEHIKLAFQEAEAKDKDYIKQEFLTFCQHEKMRNAIWKSAGLLTTGDFEQIKHVMDEAMKAGMERNLGHEYMVDIDKRMSEAAREVVKTNWELIDGHLDGGLGKGELGFIVAPAGSGKSWLLSRLGAEAMKQGKNVMHFTMELNEKYVGLRYDACFSGIAFQDVRKNVQVVKDAIANIPGKLFIKYFPLKTASAATLKMHLDRLQLVTGIKIDLMIVDYADILRPFMSDKNANSYSEAGNVYEELRSVLGELQIPGWTASQSNRGAHEEDIIEAHNVADSYRKIMTGDFILSLSRKSEDKIAGTGRIHVMKNRFGADGVTYPCSFDTSCGKIQIFDKNSAEGMELLEKAKTAQDSIKSLISKAWKKTHDSEE